MASSSETRNMDRSRDIEYDDPILLKPCHKIFLSHSGAEKEFVDQLCVDLERRDRFPFYDKRDSSLPMGERFPGHIKAAVAQCEMMVVVVSEEYFTSKWPMIELNGFVQASKGKDNSKKILPLFYGLNVKEFFDSDRQKKWFTKWEEMAKDDKRIDVDEWKESLKWLGSSNGFVYDQSSKLVVVYREKIVSTICKAITSDIKYDESHVQGRSKLCQVTRGYFENTIFKNSTKNRGVRMIGLYGLGGMGKTELCKMMCNEMDGEFDGKVCHVELGKPSKYQVVKKVVTKLTNARAELVQEMGEDKCRYVLLKPEIWKKKSFLTIDNVWDDSLELGKLCLQAPFVEGSWVIVTSRSKKTLLRIGVDEDACFEMPELDNGDAREIFLYHATNGFFFETAKDVHAIEECIKSCYFGKGEGRGSHYHPLSLKVLGDCLNFARKEPSVWMEDLQKQKSSSYPQEQINALFNSLRINFDRLANGEQELFMDLAMFSPLCIPDFRHGSMVLPESGSDFKLDLMEWLCLVHNKEKDVIENWLQHMVDCALLVHAEMGSGEVTIHELYRKFVVMEAQGKLMVSDKRRWVYARDGLPTKMEEVTRVCMEETTPRAIEWTNCKNLVVLKLYDLSGFPEELDFKALSQLRSLTVKTGVPCQTNFTIKGLKDLKTLKYIYVHCDADDTESRAYMGKLPAALQVLRLSGSVDWQRHFSFLDGVGIFSLCNNLVSLKFHNIYGPKILLLKSCTSLNEVELTKVRDLRVFESGPSIQSLHIRECPKLQEVFGLEHLAGLLSLNLKRNDDLWRVSNKPVKTLQCVGLESLTICYSRYLMTLPRFTRIQCLRFLDISGLGIREIPDLRGLEQLEGIDASCNRYLTSLKGLEGLRALNTLHLCDCQSLETLDGMKKLTNLKVLDLSCSPVLSCEEQLKWLEELPALEPVLVEPSYALDFKGRKILKLLSEPPLWEFYKGWQTCKKLGWEEKSLGGYLGTSEMEVLWRGIPGLGTKIIGTDQPKDDQSEPQWTIYQALRKDLDL